MDPNWWNNALASYDVGREHRADRENAEAWGEGGQGAYGRVAQAAGARGDLATAAAARRFEDDERQGAYERMQQIAPFARNVLRRTRAIENPEQARAFLTQPFVMQRFQDWGLTPEQLQAGIAGLTDPDPNVRQQWFDNLDAAFQQHENPDWQINQQTGQVFAIDPATGQPMQGGQVTPQRDWQTNGTRPYYIDANGAVQFGEGAIPHRPNLYSGFGGDGSGSAYSVLEPGEAEQLGLPPGSYQRNNATGQITVLGRQRGQYTDAAASSAQFASRMAAADQTLVLLEDQYTDPAGVFLAQTGAGSQYERRVRQAQREFVNAILRRESGAVISDSEFASAAQQYFPQPGDGPDVIAQKRGARQRALQGLVNASQGAYEEWYGEGSGAELPAPSTTPPPGSVIGAIVGSYGARRELLERPREIPAEEWAAMTPEERDRTIQILARQPQQ